MRTIEHMAKGLLLKHSCLCLINGRKYMDGVKYTPDYAYEFNPLTGKPAFNQAFHDLVIEIGVIDSSQDPKERDKLGQAHVIPTKILEQYAK